MTKAEEYVKSKFPEAKLGSWKIINGQYQIVKLFIYTPPFGEYFVGSGVVAYGSTEEEAWHNAAVRIVNGYKGPKPKTTKEIK